MLKEFTDKIEHGKKIAIYGVGLSGTGIKKYLEINRPDVEITFFIDAFKTGKIEGLNVISLSDIASKKSFFDCLVVATRQSAHELIEIYNYYDIPFIMISREIEQYFRTKPYLEKQKAAEKILAFDEDKKLYNMIWKIYSGSHYRELEDYIFDRYGI